MSAATFADAASKLSRDANTNSDDKDLLLEHGPDLIGELDVYARHRRLTMLTMKHVHDICTNNGRLLVVLPQDYNLVEVLDESHECIVEDWFFDDLGGMAVLGSGSNPCFVWDDKFKNELRAFAERKKEKQEFLFETNHKLMINAEKAGMIVRTIRHGEGFRSPSHYTYRYYRRPDADADKKSKKKSKQSG